MANWSDYQLGIYYNGVQGVQPDLPVSYAELERRAHAALPAAVLGYVAGGAGDENTQRRNVEAFQRWGLMPRMMVGAAERDLSVELFDLQLPSPLYLCPVGVLGVCHPEGDLETARASAATGVPMLASTLSASPLEEVAKATGATPAFFQLYPPNDRELTENLVHRAEVAGYAGIVITVDTWVNGWRPRDLGNAYLPMLRGHCLANYRSDPRFAQIVGQIPESQPHREELAWASIFGKPTLSWDDLPWFRSLTNLPLLLKGICSPLDVTRAKDGGVDGIVCSNHGGRQANGGLPALNCLAGVVAAADGMPVLFDSGVRGGPDIVKALALGATAVGVGRPYVYGLSLAGARGVEHVLRSLLAEADLTMAIDGYRSIADLTPEALVPC